MDNSTKAPATPVMIKLEISAFEAIAILDGLGLLAGQPDVMTDQNTVGSVFGLSSYILQCIKEQDVSSFKEFMEHISRSLKQRAKTMNPDTVDKLRDAIEKAFGLDKPEELPVSNKKKEELN